MKLEILVKRINPDVGLIIDEKDRKWGMVEQCPVKNGKPYWRVETDIGEETVHGTYNFVGIQLSNETEIQRYLGGAK